MKVRILRGTTIADPPVFDRSKGGDPPTFEPGDVVEVDRALAQQLVGNGKAEHISGDPLIEPAAYEKKAKKEEEEPEEEAAEEEEPEEKEEAEVVTAEAIPPETTMRPPARRRKAG